MRHTEIEKAMDLYIEKADIRRDEGLEEIVQLWTPKINAIQARLTRRGPKKFCYEIAQCERMKFLLKKQKYFGEGFQRMLRIYDLMTE